jgi:hypothetical protein
MIRVGTIKDSNDCKNVRFPDFIPIVVMTKSSEYGELSPYTLKTNEGVLIENKWQFSKVYPIVPKISQCYSRWDKTVIWSHEREVHAVQIEEDSWEIQDAYWKWREKGFECPYPVRYPVGYNASQRASCIFSLEYPEGEPLDYIEARKQIYLKEYIQAVKKEQKFKNLKKMLSEGKNLLIVEVDGPRQESLEYYKKKYEVGNDFIENKTTMASEENLTIFLNDTRHPFGHGFCLATALQNFNLQ